MFLDVWPISDPMVAIFDPILCQQLSVEHNTTKHRSLPKFLGPLVGSGDMVSSNGAQWRKWRNMFNPGVSALPNEQMANLEIHSYARSV